MAALNPFEAPHTQGPPRRRLLRAALWQAGVFGALILALDAGSTVSVEFGAFALISRFALLVGGLTAWMVAVAYVIVQGTRSQMALQALVSGLVFVVLSVVSTALLFLTNP